MAKGKLSFLAFLIFSGLTACSSNVATVQPDALTPVDEVYLLGAGDVIDVNVFNEPTVSGEHIVDQSGMVAIPLIGLVPAGGKTPDELARLITSRLGDGLIKNPNVTVEIKSYRPFFILGEIERPGRYPSMPDMTILQAIATAGGYTYRADKNYVFVRRGDEPEVRVELSSDFDLRPGDVVRVGERYF